jgi:hypothetical protein
VLLEICALGIVAQEVIVYLQYLYPYTHNHRHYVSALGSKSLNCHAGSGPSHAGP